MHDEKKLRTLKINDRRNWLLHRNGSIFFHVLFMIWGFAMIIAFCFYPRDPDGVIIGCILSIALIFIGGRKIYKVKNPFNLISQEFDPAVKVFSILKITLFFGTFFIAIPLFIFIVGIYYAFVTDVLFNFENLFIGIISFIFLLAFSFLFYSNIKEAKTLYRVSKKLGKSRIIQTSSNPKIGEHVSIQFFNEELSKQKNEITTSLFNLSERLVEFGSKNDPEDSNRRLITYVRYEEKHHFVFDESGKSLTFFINPTGTLPTKLGYEPDYWELQFRHKESGFFARFILDIQEG